MKIGCKLQGIITGKEQNRLAADIYVLQLFPRSSDSGSGISRRVSLAGNDKE
jgi:hypothetical protein